ncbi:MAG: MFS transporter [Pirellulales bacterium]
MTEPAFQPRATNIRWLIVAMLMGFTFQGHFNRNSIAVVGTEKFIESEEISQTESGKISKPKSGKLSETQMGWVYTAFLLVYTSGMLPGGWLIDVIGPRRALAGMGMGLGLCVMLTGGLGLAQLPIASLLLPLIAIRAVAGGMSVALHPGAARSVSLWMPLTSRSTANGLVTAGALVGVSVVFPLFGWMMDLLDWPLAFVVSGMVLAVFSILWLLLSADDVACHRWTNRAERDMVQAGGGVPARTKVAPRDLLGLLRNRQLVLLSLSYAAVGYYQYLFFYWIGYYFQKVLELKEQASRDATFVVYMAMAVGMVCGGMFADRLGRWLGHRRGSRVVAMTAMGLSATLAPLGLAARQQGMIVLCFSLALGALGLCEGLFWTSAPALEPRRGGLAGAFLNTVGNAGSLLAPICTPWIGKHYGWPAAIAVACVIVALGALLWLLIDTESALRRPGGE